MRVSRTRFSKRRSKRKTEFPIVAVVQKKRKVVHKPLDNKQKGKSFQDFKNKSPFQFARTRANAPSKNGFDKTRSSQIESSAVMPGVQTDLGGLPNRSNITKELPSSSASSSLHASANTGSYSTNRAQVEKRQISRVQKKSRATIDYKNVLLLRNLITAEGKILPRRISKATAKQQRHIQKAIKSARIMGLIPFINKSRPFS